MMTTLKRSLKMFVSCVKPETHQTKPGMEGNSTVDSQILSTTEEQDEEEEKKVADLGIINLSVSDDEADFDDAPGLLPIMSSSNTSPLPLLSSPITSVSQNSTTQFCPLEYYRQRVKRFVLTYKNATGPLLPDIDIHNLGKKCLLLDLDETLIHSQFNIVFNPDLEVPIQFEDGSVKPIYVCKRPGVDEFLEFCGKYFEVVIFTASLASYADPVIDFLDTTKTIRHRLYRDSCVFAEGLYLKDLSRLGRPLDQMVLIDNAATSYLLQPENGVAVRSWFSDQDDTELLKRLKPALEALPRTPDVYRWKADWSHSISN